MKYSKTLMIIGLLSFNFVKANIFSDIYHVNLIRKALTGNSREDVIREKQARRESKNRFKNWDIEHKQFLKDEIKKIHEFLKADIDDPIKAEETVKSYLKQVEIEKIHTDEKNNKYTNQYIALESDLLDYLHIRIYGESLEHDGIPPVLSYETQSQR